MDCRNVEMEMSVIVQTAMSEAYSDLSRLERSEIMRSSVCK